MSDPVRQLAEFPLLEAIFGRRSRRFGTGMKIQSGPLAFESHKNPQPLTELEHSILVASGTGMTGWNFGVPHGPDRPDAHAHYTQRFTGRTAPTAAGSGTPVLFYTNDNGTYVTNTRDAVPSRTHEYSDGGTHEIIANCHKYTRQLSHQRLDLPAQAPHMLPPNYWMANQPGSTLFMPICDASEQTLVLLAMVLANGSVVIDDEIGCHAGDLAPFIRSGLLDEAAPPTPLSVMHQIAYESSCAELSFIAHNIVLTMQAMGLGGLFLAGLNRWSVLGAFADKGVQGLGFRFVNNDQSPLPNPVGLDGVYEGLCPPYYPDMHSAVAEFVRRKFGPGGAYDPGTEGPWIDSPKVKSSVKPYSDEFTACLGEVAQYIYDKFGRFPGTFTTMVLTGYVQAVHLDTEFYDANYKPGAYLQSHADHNATWH